MTNYRVLFVPAIEKEVASAFSALVSSIEEGRVVLDTIAKYTLYLHEKQLMEDFSNAGWIEYFVDGEWQEINEASFEID